MKVENKSLFPSVSKSITCSLAYYILRIPRLIMLYLYCHIFVFQRRMMALRQASGPCATVDADDQAAFGNFKAYLEDQNQLPNCKPPPPPARRRRGEDSDDSSGRPSSNSVYLSHYCLMQMYINMYIVFL